MTTEPAPTRNIKGHSLSEEKLKNDKDEKVPEKTSETMTL